MSFVRLRVFLAATEGGEGESEGDGVEGAASVLLLFLGRLGEEEVSAEVFVDVDDDVEVVVVEVDFALSTVVPFPFAFLLGGTFEEILPFFVGFDDDGAKSIRGENHTTSLVVSSAAICEEEGKRSESKSFIPAPRSFIS